MCFVCSCSCRLKLNDDSIICYVLETTENARVVAQTEGLELLTKEDYDGDEIIYHWSGKHKKYLHGPRPSARRFLNLLSSLVFHDVCRRQLAPSSSRVWLESFRSSYPSYPLSWR